MSTTTFEAAVTRAIVKLLLGNRKLKPGVVITGGDPLGIEDKIEMGRHAVETDADLLHLEYRTEPNPALTGIAMFLPRDGRCHMQTGCCLWLSKAGIDAVHKDGASTTRQSRVMTYLQQR